MSQSATFYPIDGDEFSAIKRNPDNLDLLRGKTNYVCFPGTHEGLRFVLSKGLSGPESDLVNEIFYPSTYLGEIAQTVFPVAAEAQAFTDITDEEDSDFDKEPISYHTPEKVKQIALLLKSIGSERLLSQFDPEEMNRENVYPWCWNRSKDLHAACNEIQLLEDYQNLKQLSESAGINNNHLLCFVG